MWRDWYAGHALGLLVSGPPLALRLRGEIRRWIGSAGRRGIAEAIWLLAAIIAATGATFGQSRMPLVMLPVVPMMLATFRLGRIGAVASIVTLVVIGTGCSLAGSGPTTLLHGAMAFRLQVLQIYFACVALILLPIAAELKTRRRLLDRLRASEALQRLVLESSGDVVLGLGRDDRVRYASPQSEGAWGYTPAALIGRPSQDFIHPLDRERVREATARALAEPEVAVVVEYRVVRSDGEPLWVEGHVRATSSEEGPAGTVSVVREITDRRRLVEELSRKASTDPLTGLLNRRAFDEALATQVAGKTADHAAGCLAIFDLDHFKRINDRHGHAAGDIVLVAFARLLQQGCRPGDRVARLGGEEFAVLFDEVAPEQARVACDQIRLALMGERLWSPSGQQVFATVSVGVAALLEGDTAERALLAADAALYDAKDAGRNRLALAS